ncbi:MAG TPA: hypothetical protein VHU61_18730 [Solirubrobacteraceae bacterium]|jgi:hypothetical protein|nr:hypothetical protein [Solirubrobacteraceae bacterium]
MRAKTKRFIVGGTGVAAATAAALVLASVGSGAATAGNPMTAAQIKSLVLSGAAAMGDSTPTDISYSALTTRNGALAASGSGASMGGAYGSASGYFVVVAHGEFTAYDAPIPNGAKIPTGTVMTLVVDAATGEVTDSGVQHGSPDLSTLGPVTTVSS